MKRGWVDLAAQPGFGDVDVVSMVVFEADAVTPATHEDVVEGVGPLAFGDVHEGEHFVHAPAPGMDEPGEIGTDQFEESVGVLSRADLGDLRPRREGEARLLPG